MVQNTILASKKKKHLSRIQILASLTALFSMITLNVLMAGHLSQTKKEEELVPKSGPSPQTQQTTPLLPKDILLNDRTQITAISFNKLSKTGQTLHTSIKIVFVMEHL